jgi:lambda family phage portal protein
MLERFPRLKDAALAALRRAQQVIGSELLLPRIQASALAPYVRDSIWRGEKFAGGLGAVDLLTMDYWTLRARSRQLFRSNLYARGLLGRMVTNEINVGLHLEATPKERILKKADESLADWTEDVETRFSLWGDDPWLCDANERLTFGALQATARLEALIDGDVLVMLSQFAPTGLPRVRLVCGGAVQTPLDRRNLPKGTRIEHGVELDSNDRHVAYWVRQRDGTSKRVPAWGEKSGRRLAWLLYGSPKRLDDVRGEPMLSLVLQSLKEIDKYRDSIQRKATVLAMLAMFIKQSQATPASRPLSGGAIRRGIDATLDNTTGKARAFKSAEVIPGMVLEQLQPGEEPVAFQHNGSVEKLGEFEAAIIQAVAWSYGIPPEILRLSFSNNYSASQAAINEYKLLLNMLRTRFGDDFCAPIYQEWLLAAALSGKVQADRLLESWRDPQLYDVYGAWTSSDWAGQIKPAVDLSRLVSGYSQMVREGFITRDRATRELTGMKFSSNVKKLLTENAQLIDAGKDLALLDQKPELLEPLPDEPADDGAGENPGGSVVPLRRAGL